MENIRHQFVNLVKNRSKENSESLQDDFKKDRIGKCISTLREEVDSFIRVMYLGRISMIARREELMNKTLNGEKWNVTDREMVNKASELQGYIHYVYKFGCGFIHLSNSHNYKTHNPFLKLSETEKSDIKKYLNQYHNFPMADELSVDNIRCYIPDIFKKISSNLICYFNEILNDKMITV